MAGIKKTLAFFLLFTVLLSALPGSAFAAFHIEVSADELDPAPGLGDEWMNVLLIGTDSRADEKDAGRSDSMMICSIRRETGEARLVSLARDMWVPIPGTVNGNKLNAAHSYGGPNLLMKTINNNFGMNLTRYLSVNFHGMARLVDLIGGVDMELTAGEVRIINAGVRPGDYDSPTVSLTPGAGTRHLSGAQALAYARIRKLDNDFGRTARQRKLLVALLSKARALPVTEQLGLLASANSSFSTNMTPEEISELAMFVLSEGVIAVRELSLPSEGTYRYERRDGVSTLVTDIETTGATLRAFIYGE